MMKKLASLVIVLLLAVALCGCGDPGFGSNPPQETPELLELNTAALGNVVLLDADSDGKYAALLYVRYTADDSVGAYYYLSLFDLQKNAELKSIALENEMPDGYELSVTAEGVELCRQVQATRTVYDFSLENPVTHPYVVADPYQIAQTVDTVDPDRMNCQDGYAVSYDYGASQTAALVFYDRAEQIYLLKSNPHYQYKHANGHQMLVIDNTGNLREDYRSVIRIFDFDRQQELNALTIPNGYVFNNVEGAVKVNDTCAIISTVKDNGTFDKLYVWDYARSAQNRSFEPGFCEMVAGRDLDGKIREACLRIQENTGVTVTCAPEMEFIKMDEISNDVKPIEFYRAVLDLEHYLSLVPKAAYQELLCKDLTAPVASFDEFRIYLVGDFPGGEVSAFAGNLCSDETDDQHIVYIVYACYSLNQKTFFHELMHSFEYRIWNCDARFDQAWEALNPKGFKYTDDYVSAYYDDANRAWQDFFARDYGMKNILEDRATCFEELCDGMLTDNCWWKDKPNLLAKQRYLAQTLKMAFPSLSAWKLLEIS